MSITQKYLSDITATQKIPNKSKKRFRITPQYHLINKKRNEKSYKMKVINRYDLTSKTVLLLGCDNDNF